MLHRINELLNNDESFAFETTLATKSYKNKILQAKQNGYTVTLLFFWLKNIELAKNRVRTRVLEGGHNIEPEVIERRYVNGIKNLFDIYLPIVDGVMILDNSGNGHKLIASRSLDGEFAIFDEQLLNEIKERHVQK